MDQGNRVELFCDNSHKDISACVMDQAYGCPGTLRCANLGCSYQGPSAAAAQFRGRPIGHFLIRLIPETGQDKRPSRSLIVG
eukprot:g29304.t1